MGRSALRGEIRDLTSVRYGRPIKTQSRRWTGEANGALKPHSARWAEPLSALRRQNEHLYITALHKLRTFPFVSVWGDGLRFSMRACFVRDQVTFRNFRVGSIRVRLIPERWCAPVFSACFSRADCRCAYWNETIRGIDRKKQILIKKPFAFGK